MKMAVQYWLNQGVRTRKTFVAFRGGYHGDTTGAMAVCDPEAGMHALFRGLLPEHVIADLPVDEESDAALSRLLERHAERDRRHHRRAAGAGRRRHAIPRRRRARAAARGGGSL